MSSKDFFDRVAQDWDEMRESYFSEDVREGALAVADVQRGKVDADIGAGTGFISQGLVREGLRVIAVDQSEAILNEMSIDLLSDGPYFSVTVKPDQSLASQH